MLKIRRPLYELYNSYGHDKFEDTVNDRYCEAYTLGKAGKLTLRRLIKYGFNSIRTFGGGYLGYDEEDFADFDLDMPVTIADDGEYSSNEALYEDADGYWFCIRLSKKSTMAICNALEGRQNV